jgi:recyclin-1
LDDHVAAGMDKAVQVMINQAEYILMKEHVSADYNTSKMINDLNPTRACINVIRCLKAHTRLLIGASDKNTMEIFYGEIGVRLFKYFCYLFIYSVVTKHIKHGTINQNGALKLIWYFVC